MSSYTCRATNAGCQETSCFSTDYIRVRLHIIGNARIKNVGKSHSCMCSALPIILCNQTVHTRAYSYTGHAALQLSLTCAGIELNLTMKACLIQSTTISQHQRAAITAGRPDSSSSPSPPTICSEETPAAVRAKGGTAGHTTVKGNTRIGILRRLL